jgi:hypothetical protein
MMMHHSVIDELRRRAVVRTSNAPLGDYAEYLFSAALGLKLESNSKAGHDATGPDGSKYQIKSRRVVSTSRAARQLSVFRGLPEAKFDVLAAVLFDGQCKVIRAVLVPHAIVLQRSVYAQHVNGWRLVADETLFALPNVTDVTGALQRASDQITK